MPQEQSTADDIPPQDAAVQTHDTAVRTPSTHTNAPIEEHASREPIEDQEEWYDGPVEPELPRRPRRRLLTPIPLTLLGVLLIACGFIAGVLVEKGESSSSNASASGGLASRFAALRSGATGATSAGRGGAGASGGGGFAGGPSAAGNASATVGQVAYLSGSTLYVTTSEGNTVKVTTSAGSTVTKTVKAAVKSIHPGETVIVTGSAGTGGTVDAESIRVSEAGASGGLGALFGGGGGRRGRSGGGGEPALFGG
jgi:hypothetical protein